MLFLKVTFLFLALTTAVTYNSKSDEWQMWNMGLQKNSIVIPSDDTDRLCQACRDAGVYCVMGVNELDDANGVFTFYNTQILLGPEGTILGRHRKLKPTYNERVYWGEGDGSDIGAYDTNIGRVGMLCCWEHHTIAIRAAQILQGEEFHIANWPAIGLSKDQRQSAQCSILRDVMEIVPPEPMLLIPVLLFSASTDF